MEECESLDSEMAELKEFQCEGTEAIDQDDEDELEELQNSLREVVQDQSVKPKLQCLMVDPSFSMVTVQSEDSGIVWETASSRCSTPWASETSSISEACSMEGPGAAGKITIVFDEEKIIRRRTRSGGRSSRLGDRLSRPGSSRSASALGVERPEMVEVSVPNVKQEKKDTALDLEKIKDKDQQLFSLISEGYEILNIRVPSKLPTVDEEESTELQDNLSYLNQTPGIKSRNQHDWAHLQNHTLPGEVEVETLEHKEPSMQDFSQPTDTEVGQTHTQKGRSSDMDYFEKFTLVDEAVPSEQAPEQQEDMGHPVAKSQEEEQKPGKETATDSPPASEDSFVFVTDEDIGGELLDEVFYGNKPQPDALQQKEDNEVEAGEGMRMRRESQRSVKENGSVLFGSEETTLTPIFLSPGPPKIIDPILLEEPTAMSFLYSDLYEDAIGERSKSDEECSEAESVTSEKSFKRFLSDSEEVDGYLEKFILKDETPTVEVQPDSMEDKGERKMIWSQSKFEMTGCLTRVLEEEDEGEEDKGKKEEPRMQAVSTSEMREDIQAAKTEAEEKIEVEEETVTETEKEMEDMQRPVVIEEEAVMVRETSEELMQESKLVEEQMEDQEVKHKGDRSTDEPVPETQQVDIIAEKTEKSDEHQREEPAEKINEDSITGTQQSHHAQKLEEQIAEVFAKDTEETEVKAAVSSEALEMIDKSEMPAENTETRATDTVMEAADEKVEEKIVTKEETPSKTKEPETERPEMLTPTEPTAETETSAETSCDKIMAVVPENSASFEVIPEPAEESEVVDEIENAAHEKEIQTQVQVPLQEVTSAPEVQMVALGEKEEGALMEETAIERLSPECVTEPAITNQESDVKTDFSCKVTEPPMIEEDKIDSDKKQLEIKQSKAEESVTGKEAETDLIDKVEAKTTEEDKGAVVEKTANVADELILLVPKGQVVEMDIEIAQQSEKIIESDNMCLPKPDDTCENLISPENALAYPEPLQAQTESIAAEPQLEEKPEPIPEQEAVPTKDLDKRRSPPGIVEEADTEEEKMERDFEEDSGAFSPLRSFTPQEDLSGLHREEEKEEESEAADVEPNTEMHKVEDFPETDVIKEDVDSAIELRREDVEEKMEEDEEAAAGPEVTTEEFEYEIISKQEARAMTKAEMQRDIEETKPEPEEREEIMEMEVETKMEERVLDLSPEEDLTEADYDIIDAEEERQARLAAELQGMDWFCLTCGCLLSEDDCVSAEHRGHKQTSVDTAYEDIKEKLGEWISELQGRSENIEDLVSELELAYNSVEDQFVESEDAMQAQNDEMMALVMEQYNCMSVNMEEEKKAKLERLYDQIVSFQESIDSAKTTLETTAREAETDTWSPEDIHERLRAALESAMLLELGPRALLVFEDYAKGNASSSHSAQRKGIPVPQRPTLQLQELGSATSTSVTVYWEVSPGDIIDCFQVYCMEDPQGAVSEEYRVTVKESYCVLEELEPDRTYKVWVMAVNYTGCSLPSERLCFRTAPSVPAIDTEQCTVMWDSATLRWNSAKQTPGQSYTLEYCRQYELEGEGLRSISGIKSCEQKVLLQPNVNYLFYIKAVNEAGVSEQSEAALISTKGTRFHLLEASAHPSLELSADQTTVHYSQDTHDNAPYTDKQCPSILGELLPARGHYYWETTVSGSTAYRLGVAYSGHKVDRNSPLGENSMSWCLQCIFTPSCCRYQLLHNDVQSDVTVIEMPERVGTLLDYQLGRLSFYNAQTGQLLGTLTHRFTQPCHPALSLEMPGSLELSMALEVPEFAKHS
ncbi:hypothetical protein LDENG_00286910 [Lucifuga dentata]|nr:hypothetical protein LDENG_00286910 [Lucifuga dentata]